MIWLVVWALAAITLPVAATWSVELLAQLLMVLGPEWMADVAYPVAIVAMVAGGIVMACMYEETRRGNDS